MFESILIAALAAATTYWFKRKVSTMALIYFMEQKSYNPPTEEEMKECTSYVTRHMMHLD